MNIKIYIYICLFALSALIVGISMYKYNNLISENEDLKKRNKNLEAVNKNNALFIKVLQEQRIKDIDLLARLHKDNNFLEKRRKQLLKVINVAQDENLSASDREFIEILYPNKEIK